MLKCLCELNMPGATCWLLSVGHHSCAGIIVFIDPAGGFLWNVTPSVAELVDILLCELVVTK